MNMKNLLTRFYCLPIPYALLMTAIMAIVFLLFRQRFEKHRWWKAALTTLLLLCVGVIIYTTAGSRRSAADLRAMYVPFHSYREAANSGNREILRSNLMNVLLFYPAGLVAINLFPGRKFVWRRICAVAFLFTVFSGMIEFTQYSYALGNAEIDDVLHNGTGALAGALTGTARLHRGPKWGTYYTENRAYTEHQEESRGNGNGHMQ